MSGEPRGPLLALGEGRAAALGMRVLRAERGWRQADLGTRLGVSQTWVYIRETGGTRVSAAEAGLIAEALGTTAEGLIEAGGRGGGMRHVAHLPWDGSPSGQSSARAVPFRWRGTPGWDPAALGPIEGAAPYAPRHGAPQERMAQRYAEFTHLREQGVNVVQAGARVGVSADRARRYEQMRKRELAGGEGVSAG